VKFIKITQDLLVFLEFEAHADGLSWEALRWKARCVDVDCDQGSEAFACYEAVDEWSLRHLEARGHSVMLECEWDLPDGTVVCAPEEMAVRRFRGENDWTN